MATILYLDGTQVYPDSTQSIRLIRENPYFTQSETYTLDVTIPMDILENRVFFRNMHRMERSKDSSPMACRLVVDNRLLMSGSAKVTQVKEREIKVQLLGGKSEINFLAREGGEYIDQMHIGDYTVYRDGSGAVHHETTEGIRLHRGNVYSETDGNYRVTRWISLVDLALFVIRKAGYTVVECCVDAEPWNRLYVCTAMMTGDDRLEHCLPHWLTSEFIAEFSKFFNVTVCADQQDKTVRIVSNEAFFTGRERTGLDPVDEYLAEIASDDEGKEEPLANANIAFSMSGSASHDYDCIDENVRKGMMRKTYATETAARDAWGAMAATERRKYAFCTPTGTFASWVDYDDEGNERGEDYVAIDLFAPLVRDGGNDSQTELKIVPVAINSELKWSWGGTPTSTRMPMPSMENPTGDETQDRQGEDEGDGDAITLQDYIEGNASIESAGKEDRMQVCFIGRNGTTAFTDQVYKSPYSDGVPSGSWSLSLNPVDRSHYLGQLHRNSFSFNTRARQAFHFLSDLMPDPSSVFVIRGKMYGCEKIEATITADGMDRYMTGYFYEMLENPLVP